MTAELNLLVLDPSDRAVIVVFDRHLQWGDRRCLICGQPSGDLLECVGCIVADDATAKRREDV
jgi:hypothetical protein